MLSLIHIFTACHEIGVDAAFCIQKRAVSLEEAMDRDAAMQNLTDTCKEMCIRDR